MEAEQWLDNEDRAEQEARLQRLRWIADQIPNVDWMLYGTGPISKYLFDEARYCQVRIPSRPPYEQTITEGMIVMPNTQCKKGAKVRKRSKKIGSKTSTTQNTPAATATAAPSPR
jgi:hypothetical protein